MQWHHAPILILHVIYSFVGQCIFFFFLCKVKMLLYIYLVPFVKRNISYFHCSFIVSLYYTVAYYSEELVKRKDVAKPQMFEGNETEGRAQHLTKKKNLYIYIYIYTRIHIYIISSLKEQSAHFVLYPPNLPVILEDFF